MTDQLREQLPAGSSPSRPEKRSPHWDAFRHQFLKTHPKCAGCGGLLHLNVHHIRPFHLFPSLELIPENLITLCEDPARLCHYRLGHCFDWSAYNLNVMFDASLQLSRVVNRLYGPPPVDASAKTSVPQELLHLVWTPPSSPA